MRSLRPSNNEYDELLNRIHSVLFCTTGPFEGSRRPDVNKRITDFQNRASGLGLRAQFNLFTYLAPPNYLSGSSNPALQDAIILQPFSCDFHCGGGMNSDDRALEES